jgi:hypothetical protein
MILIIAPAMLAGMAQSKQLERRAEETLRALEARPTRQRITVLAELMDESNDLTAQELHQRLRRRRVPAGPCDRLPDTRSPERRGRDRRPLPPTGRGLLSLVRRGPPPSPRLLELPQRRRGGRLRAYAVARPGRSRPRVRGDGPSSRGCRPLRRLPRCLARFCGRGMPRPYTFRRSGDRDRRDREHDPHERIFEERAVEEAVHEYGDET